MTGAPPRVQLAPMEAVRRHLHVRLALAQDEGVHTAITSHGNLAGFLVDPVWYAAARAAMGQPTDVAPS